jgi:hypothetical protein
VANGGGTIDGIVAVTCDRDESAARLDAVRGLAVPTAHLATTDIDDPEFAAYATTATGTRVGAIDTQGDQTGGIIIDWVVVAGYRGFVVHPAQFAYVDGTFTDPGIVEPGVGGASPAGHRVRPGTVFQFAVDYSTIARDPNGPGAGVYRFRAGATTIGTWR